jgi:hypothetical protein
VASDPRVDELRDRLRALGYLDAGVNRFVLGPTRGTRRPSAIALRSSLRVGALAAVLLGPAAAIGLGARIPGLVTGPRDAIVIALYLGLLFGAAMSIAAYVVALLAAFAARRPSDGPARRGRLWPQAAGAVVALACLAYLTLWWTTVIAGVGWSAPLWTLSALAVAAAISVLLGHAVSVMTSALIVAGGDEAAARTASWRTSLATGAAALGVAALLLTSAQAGSVPATAPSPALTVVPSGLRIRVVAIDGFDPRIFGELSAHGRVPSLAAAFNAPLVALQADEREASDPARVWTTIATGQPAQVHGVQSLETRRVAGVAGTVTGSEQSTMARAIRGATDLVRLTRPAIASGSERRAKTFWEVAADAGLRTAVVNWWATWPARDGAGIVLSDRATLRLEHGGALDAEIAPSDLYERLGARYAALKTRAAEMTASALPTRQDRATRALLERSAQLDAMQLMLLFDIAGRNTDLAVVYLPGLDIAQHALLGDNREGLAASALGARLEALKDYYSALDRLLASTSALNPERDELIVVLTEPGRVSGGGGARMAARGGGVAAPRQTNAAATAVAATILYALGVPVARDLASPPVVEIFDGRFREAYPVREVSTYGQPAAAPASRRGQPLDQEMIDRLRSLGYVR